MRAQLAARTGRPPANKGRRYPADPPRVEEIVAVMRRAGERPHGLRIRTLISVLWRSGLRIGEALALNLRISFATRMRSRWHGKASRLT
jgi:integrase